MRKDFYYPSSDGVTDIHAVEWIPENEIKTILQISHGMVEYIMRYQDFARYLNRYGIYVTGNDHLGHGESVSSIHGYFHHPDGNECLIEDIHKLRCITEEKYPDIPYFVLGHSMGSFLIRQYIMIHGEEIAGAIVMGTGSQSSATLALGKTICKTMAAVKGWDYQCEPVHRMAFASYNKRLEPVRTPYDWLTKDEEIVDAYMQDPWCTFTFTLNGFYQMFRGIEYIQKDENIRNIPEDCPVLLVSGEEDPVGDYGKGVRKVYQSYRKIRKDNESKKLVRLRLYPGDRHEILNEKDREKVYRELRIWIMKSIR